MNMVLKNLISYKMSKNFSNNNNLLTLLNLLFNSLYLLENRKILYTILFIKMSILYVDINTNRGL